MVTENRQNLESGPENKFSRERLNKILGGIEIEASDKPKIVLSDFGLQELGELESGLDSTNTEQIIAVIRCWNKDQKSIGDLLERLEKIRANVPGFKGAFIAINDKEEKGNLTEESISGAKSLTPSELSVVPLRIKNYSWTSGLNSAIALLNELTTENKIGRDNVRVMNMSFDVDLGETDLVKLQEAAQSERFIFTARKTADGETPFTEKNADELWDKLKQLLRNPRGADLTELAYLMRNTFNVIRLSDLVEMGGFNPACNGKVKKYDRSSAESTIKSVSAIPQEGEKNLGQHVKGMEDAEFFMRLILRALSSGNASTIKDLRKSLSKPILYTDKSWAGFHEIERVKKIANEIVSMSVIFKMGVTEDYVLPEGEQDFRLHK